MSIGAAMHGRIAQMMKSKRLQKEKGTQMDRGVHMERVLEMEREPQSELGFQMESDLQLERELQMELGLQMESGPQMARTSRSRVAWLDRSPEVPTLPRAILIVEDETSIRRLLVYVLSSMGYRIESVANGSLALRILEDDPAIELVLTDLNMPGMSGTEVAEWVARSRPEVKVVCMSGHAKPFEAALNRLLEMRRVDFLPKPFMPSQVIQLVKQLLEAD